MEVSLDVSAVPLTDEEIQTILSARQPREEITIEKTCSEKDIKEKEPLPDPVFEKGEFVPWVYDAGASLSRLDSYAAEFSGLIEQMFAASHELKLTKEGMEQLIAVKNE
jgi:hypothetical protein